MHDARESGQDYPVRLSILQRRLIAGLAPEFADRLKLSEQNQRVITFDLPEWTTIRRKVESATIPMLLTCEAGPSIRRSSRSRTSSRKSLVMAISRSPNGSINSRSP